MQIKLTVRRITQNENGTVATKLEPTLVNDPGGTVVTGELFIVAPSQADQPEALVYGAELNSDLGVFVEVVEEPGAPPV